MVNKSDAEDLNENDGIQKETLSGSESIARAVIDAGVAVAASYPGGPVTRIVEKLIDLSSSCDLYVQWSNCEKVAFEVALGCSLAGRRAVIAAKHVGINHILDPLMTVNLTGCGGGIIRDVLARQIPMVLRSEVYATACIIGGIFQVGALAMGFDNTTALLSGAISTLLIRLGAIKWHLSLPTFAIDR